MFVLGKIKYALNMQNFIDDYRQIDHNILFVNNFFLNSYLVW
jgi:hypothetical protein